MPRARKSVIFHIWEREGGVLAVIDESPLRSRSITADGFNDHLTSLDAVTRVLAVGVTLSLGRKNKFIRRKQK